MTNPPMNRKARRAAGNRDKAPGGPLAALLEQAGACLAGGDPAAGAKAAEMALALDAASPLAHYLLGTARLFAGRPAEAAEALRQAVRLAASFPEAHNNLGVALERLGRTDDAADCYRRALKLNARYAEAHNNLGNVRLAAGRPDEAARCFQAALEARGAYPEALHNLGNALAACHRPAEAETAFRQAVRLAPDLAEAWNNLGALLLDQSRPEEALAACRQAAKLAPGLAETHYTLGRALQESGQADQAPAAYRRAIVLAPGDADALLAMGSLLAQGMRHARGLSLLKAAQRITPLRSKPAALPKAAFSVLFLTAPGYANTPSDYLVARAGYDSHFLAVVEGADYDFDALGRRADLVFNLVSDADQDSEILPLTGAIAGRLGRRVLNPPESIAETGREKIAARLAGIEGCRVPRTVRLAGASLAGPGLSLPEGLSHPLLIRQCGAHGGDAFEKLEDEAAIAAFASRRPEADYYLSAFIPYRSPDGHYRKYRMIVAGGRLFPYHLAVGSDWKVHYFRTRMAERPDLQAEELAFLDDPAAVLGPRAYSALEKVAATIGLDYFGIDCALDEAGDLLVFEANATMLVHGETGALSAKQPFIARIRDAFESMLADKAGRGAGTPERQ